SSSSSSSRSRPRPGRTGSRRPWPTRASCTPPASTPSSSRRRRARPRRLPLRRLRRPPSKGGRPRTARRGYERSTYGGPLVYAGRRGVMSLTLVHIGAAAGLAPAASLRALSGGGAVFVPAGLEGELRDLVAEAADPGFGRLLE